MAGGLAVRQPPRLEIPRILWEYKTGYTDFTRLQAYKKNNGLSPVVPSHPAGCA